MITRILIFLLFGSFLMGQTRVFAQSEWSVQVNAGQTWGSEKQFEYSGSVTEEATLSWGVSMRRRQRLGDRMRLIGELGYEINRQLVRTYSGGRIGGNRREGTFPLDRIKTWWAPELRWGKRTRRGWVALGPVGSWLMNNAMVPVASETWLLRQTPGSEGTIEYTSRMFSVPRKQYFRTLAWGFAAQVGWQLPLGSGPVLDIAVGYERGISDWTQDAFSSAKWCPQRLSLDLGLILAGPAVRM